MPPRQVRVDVPKALEAVCAKAMARKPEDRYATASELGGDIERWLADEPVSGYREPSWVKARRWARRHRLLVSAAAAVAVLTVSLAVGAALLGAANANLREEQARTQEAIKADEKRRKEAREALDAQTSLVLGDLLSRQAVLAEEHKRLLRQSLQAYERFAANTGQDEESRASVAKAYGRVGRIRQRLGLQQEAKAAYLESARLSEQLIADFPDSHGHVHMLAAARDALGELHHQFAEWEPARDAHEQSIDLLSKLVKDHPDNFDYRYDLAVGYGQLAVLHSSTVTDAAGRV